MKRLAKLTLLATGAICYMLLVVSVTVGTWLPFAAGLIIGANSVIVLFGFLQARSVEYPEYEDD